MTNFKKIESYLPLVDGSIQQSELNSWKDEEGAKKNNIGFEYSQQKLRQTNSEKKGESLESKKENPLIM